MGLAELFILAVGLSMDAFAVAVCKGLSLKRVTPKNAAWVGLWFGAFQALMPYIGYILGTQFKNQIEVVSHWIAFALLALIGANMIKEALCNDEECVNSSLSARAMFPLAVATSIDALVVGVSLAALKIKNPDSVNIGIAVGLIGVVTFIISSLGVKIGNIFGAKYKSKAELVGGAILIILGIKILIEHLMA